MAKKYEYQYVRINDLLLDDENPRFASSVLVQSSVSKVSQSSIVEHLLKYADIQKLAHRINEVHELHGAELITCYRRGDKYVVLEGNRRVCACKLLLDRSLIPEMYKRNFPFISDETKENLESIMVIVYPDRESVQAYLSDRHISGVKKWSALEKNNYYMNLFQTHKDIDTVKHFTSDTVGVIKNCIIKYQFFMEVFKTLQEKHQNIEIEKLDYLPMVDRFMDLLVGNDIDVGLSLQLNENLLKYYAPQSKRKIYKNILIMIGEAFLLRKEKKNCVEGELSKIISTEISNVNKQKKLIQENVRIPGLLALISEYKNSISDDHELESAKDDSDYEKSYIGNGDTTYNSDVLDKGQEDNLNYGLNIDDNNKYVPTLKYRPKKVKREYLCFSKDEASEWNINGDSDFEVKIRSVLFDLAKLSVYDHPYACVMLYRSLLEICTRFVYHRNQSSINRDYDENNLNNSMKYLVNNFLFNNSSGKDIPKIKEAIMSNLKKPDIIQILNLYIHYSNPVDEQILLSTWNSIKFYISACLK